MGKLPEYVYMSMGKRLSDACDYLEQHDAPTHCFYILTPVGKVKATVILEKVQRGG
jgi:hypothetical protein